MKTLYGVPQVTFGDCIMQGVCNTPDCPKAPTRLTLIGIPLCDEHFVAFYTEEIPEEQAR